MNIRNEDEYTRSIMRCYLVLVLKVVMYLPGDTGDTEASNATATNAESFQALPCARSEATASLSCFHHFPPLIFLPKMMKILQMDVKLR